MKHPFRFILIALFVLLLLFILSNVPKMLITPKGKSLEIIDSPTPEISVNSTKTPYPTPTIENNSSILNTLIVSGNQAKSEIIFTFDGGSTDESLVQILTILNKYQIKSSFFLTGKWIEEYPEDVIAIVKNGHEVFNHTYAHSHLTNLTVDEIAWELNYTDQLMQEIAGISTKPYFRPPYGEYNSIVLETAYNGGYQGVYWTLDAWDWRESEGFTAEQIKERVLANLSPGAIILFHIGDSITGTILSNVIYEIEDQGYTIVPLSLGID